jgi:3-hydroxyisobutyrate dehydrogenase-like beta-hydroxyacid dehydrogenase
VSDVAAAPKNAGHSVKVFDINQSSIDSLTASGATAASSPAEAAAGVDTIVTMLPSSPHVDGVFNGPDGILSNDTLPGTLILIGLHTRLDCADT